MAKTRSVVGDHISFRGLIYGPNNEQGVVFLFSKVAEDLNMYVEEIKEGFPDCVARRFDGKGWERIHIEFEYRSSHFKAHDHDPAECDIIVCWEHDWTDCPIEVLELKAIIPDLPNRPTRRPDAASKAGGLGKPEDLFQALSIPAKVRGLYNRLEPRILSLGEGVWRKASWRKGTPTYITFYSPKRVFIYVHPQKSQLALTLFTRGGPMNGVKPAGSEGGGQKWGNLRFSRDEDLESAAKACHESYGRILGALAANEATGWYARVGSEEPSGDDAA